MTKYYGWLYHREKIDILILSLMFEYMDLFPKKYDALVGKIAMGIYVIVLVIL